MKTKILAIHFLCWSILFFIQAYGEGPVLTVQPDPQYEYIFGVVEIGNTSEKYIYIMNTGQGTLLGSATIEKPEEELENTQKEGEHRKEGEEGEEEEVFFLSGDTSFSLTENQIATIKVQFIPLKEKEYTAKVKVVASDNQNAEINIRGIGKKKPKAFYFFGCGDATSKNHIDKVDFLCLFILLCILLRFNYRKKGISLTK